MERTNKHKKAGHHLPTNETPFKLRFVGGPMVVRHSMLAGEFENRSLLLSELTICMLGIFHVSVEVC